MGNWKKIFFNSILFLVLFFSYYSIRSQTIVNDSFENTTTLFSNSGSTYYSGNSATGDRPATSPFASDATYGIGVSNGTAILTSSVINTSACSSIQLSFNLAAFSIGSTTNGLDATDYVEVDISPDGGTTYYNTIQINGNNNAYWAYSATGIASTPYDGNATPVSFSPAAGGSRTTDGYSTVTVTGLPSVSNLMIKITMVNNSSSERWVIDHLIVSGSCTVCTAPTTTLSSSGQTICSTSSVNVGVSSSASSPTYTWQASSNGSSGWATATNGTPSGATYSGVNSSSLSITPGSTYYYRCLVTESGTCTATSSTYSLTVNVSPSITTQPTNKTICSGANTSFGIAASGTSLSYQWQENSGSGFTNISNGGVYSGATSATLNLTAPPTSMNSYSYQCIVSVSSCSSTTTNVAILTVNTTPSAPPAPSAPSNPACNTGTLSANSSTVAGVTWYWQGTSSAGTSTVNSTATNYTFASSGTYYVRALDASGTCWSSSSSLSVTVNAAVAITSGATDKGICSGNNTSMAISAGTATKQWYVSTDNGTSFSSVVSNAVYTSGMTTNTLTITNPPVSYNGYQYYCTVSVSGCPTLTSSIGVLTVTQTPSTPPSPVASANPGCSSTTLTAMSSTVAGVTWYWEGTSSAGTSSTSPTSSDYVVSSSGTYYVRARTDGSSCLSNNSSSISITINQPPTITINPSDRTMCVGTNTTFAVSATGTSISYQWQINTGSGFTNLTNSAPYSNVTTATLNITSITGSMDGYQYRCVVSGASPCSSSTSNFATLYITASGAPVIPASLLINSNIACNAFKLSWTNGSGSNRLVVLKSGSSITGTPTDGVSYTASANFGSGNTIAAGEYVVYNGSGNSVFIYGLNPTTTYYYSIFEFNGCSASYLTSGSIPNGNITTGSCTNPAGITAVYVDACGGSCGYEGSNELIWGQTGSYAMYVNSNGPTLHYNSTTPPSTVYISTYGINSSNITTLNTAVSSCSNTVFVDPNTQGFIPANANFLIANNCMCSPSAYDLSGLCNKGPIYVVFGTNASWPCNNSGGIFGNGNACNGSPRYFDLNMTSWGIALDPIYSYDPCVLTSGADGDMIFLNPSGGAAVTYSNSGCTTPVTVLPIELLDFYGIRLENNINLTWKVASEKNIQGYLIEKSTDGLSFTELTKVPTYYSAQQIKEYHSVDLFPGENINYYRLSTIEQNGQIHYYKVISVDNDQQHWSTSYFINNSELNVVFKNSLPKNAQLFLYDMTGNLMASQNITKNNTVLNVSNLSSGIYIVKILSPYRQENFKINIQN